MTWSKIRVGTIGSTYPSGLSFERFSCDDEKVVTTNPSLYYNNQPIPPSKDDKTPQINTQVVTTQTRRPQDQHRIQPINQPTHQTHRLLMISYHNHHHQHHCQPHHQSHNQQGGTISNPLTGLCLAVSSNVEYISH